MESDDNCMYILINTSYQTLSSFNCQSLIDSMRENEENELIYDDEELEYNILILLFIDGSQEKYGQYQLLLARYSNETNQILLNSTAKLTYDELYLHFDGLFKLYLLDMNNGELNCKYDSSKYNNIIPDKFELKYYIEENN